MKIIRLQAENFKRLRAVDISTNGDSVIVAGRNDQGKSSVIDSIMAAIGGRGACPDDPIRHGAEKAGTTVDLGDLIVSRRFTKAGTYLEVIGKDGSPLKSPQAVLDRLVGKLSFDPLAFAAMGGKQRREALLSCVDLDLDLARHETMREQAYQIRRDLGRDLKEAEAQLKAMPRPTSPTSEISPGEAVAALQEAMDTEGKRRQLQERRENADRAADAQRQRIAELQKALDEAQTRLADILHDLTRTEEALAQFPPNTVEEARQQLQEIEQHNQMARQAAAYKEQAAKAASLRRQHAEAEDTLSRLDALKQSALAAAEMPVPGLDVTEGDVSVDGVLFDQLSTSRKIRVSLAIAMKANPDLRVILIRDGNDLDSENLKEIMETAAAEDYQLWIERVDESGRVGVVIEDGEVKE